MTQFLKARWEHLILATYAVEDDLLAHHLPTGLELDRFEGNACVSFVAFRFLDTRVWGIRWPLHVNFNEVNLRFYVREPDGTRGVVFVREFVPSPITSTIARVCYNEPYSPAKITDTITQTDTKLSVGYSITRKGRHEVSVDAEAHPEMLPSDSTEHFFKEHEWGYGETRGGRLLRYRVEHPAWRTYTVRSTRVAVDFGRLYGQRWSVLNHAEPLSVVLAEGSAISVSTPESMD